MMESRGVGPLPDPARAGRAPRRGEQSRQQQLPLRGFPFNGLVFVLYIRKTVNNKYCVIGLHLPLVPPAFCGGEGHCERWGRLRSRERCPARGVGTTEQGSIPAPGGRVESGAGEGEVTCVQAISQLKRGERQRCLVVWARISC